MMSSSEDEDVPPLDDFTDIIEKSQKTAAKELKVPPSKPRQILEVEPDVKNFLVTPPKSAQAPIQSSSAATAAAAPKKESYGGLKKGFLFAPKEYKPTPAKSSGENASTPIIKPQAKQVNPLEIPEVQAAMKVSEVFGKNTDWVTDELIANVQKSETISKRLADPTFMRALKEFQTNPEAARTKYRYNPEVQKFWMEFCGLMGDHFTKLGTSNPQTSNAKPDVVVRDPGEKADIQQASNMKPGVVMRDPGEKTNIQQASTIHQLSSDDKAKIQELLANQEVRELLVDREVQKFIETLKTNPRKAHRDLVNLDLDMKNKIMKLCEYGLLEFHR